MFNKTIWGQIARQQSILLAIAMLGLWLFNGRLQMDMLGMAWASLGLAIIAVSALSMGGTWESTRSFNYQYSMTMNNKDQVENANHTQGEIKSAFGFFLRQVSIGVLAIVGGVGLMIVESL